MVLIELAVNFCTFTRLAVDAMMREHYRQFIAITGIRHTLRIQCWEHNYAQCTYTLHNL